MIHYICERMADQNVRNRWATAQPMRNKLKYLSYRYFQVAIAKHGPGNSNGIKKSRRPMRHKVQGWGVRRRAYVTHIAS